MSDEAAPEETTTPTITAHDDDDDDDEEETTTTNEQEEEEETEDDDAMALLAASKARMAEIAEDQAATAKQEQNDNPIDDTIEVYEDDEEENNTAAAPQDGTTTEESNDAIEKDETRTTETQMSENNNKRPVEVHTSATNDDTLSFNNTFSSNNTTSTSSSKPNAQTQTQVVETKEQQRARESIQLAEEAALLLAASKARLATPTALVDGPKEVTTEIKPLEDDEEIESVHEDDDDEDSSTATAVSGGEEDIDDDDLPLLLDGGDGTTDENKQEGEENAHENEDVPTNGDDNGTHSKSDDDANKDEESDFDDDAKDEDEPNEEDIRASEEARAYAAAMLTVADVSEKHNSRRVSYGALQDDSSSSSNNNNDNNKNPASPTRPNRKEESRKSTGLMGTLFGGGAQEEPLKEEEPSSTGGDDAAGGGATYIDKKYVANMEHLPPHLINALLHEEAMLAAEKAALEGKDRHVFNMNEAAELSAEVQEHKLKHLRDQAEQSFLRKKNKGNAIFAHNFVGNIRQWFKEQRDAIKVAALEQEKERQRRIVNDRLMSRSSFSGDSSNPVKVRLKWRDSESSDEHNSDTVAPSNVSTDLATPNPNPNNNNATPGSPGSVPDINIVREKIPEGSPDFLPFILSRSQMQTIAATGLPVSVKWCRWKRCYSLARDGDSFEAMLRLVKSNEKTLLVIRSTTGAIFGGYADSTWQSPLQAGNTFYGTGQAMLYKINDDNEVKIYKWSGMNRYIQLCDTVDKRLAMGGGGTGGNFGLCVEEDFSRGSTGPCQTFENEPLCEGGEFDILDFEVYGFLSYKF